MSLLRHINRLLFVDLLISKKATGTPQKFARKNRIGRSSMMNLLKEMRELGFDVKYDKERETYYYGRQKRKALLISKILKMESVEILTREHIAKICGEDVEQLCFSEKQIFEKCE